VMCSPTYFQEVMEKLLVGLEGVHVYIDDIMIFSHTIVEHDAVLSQVFARLEAAYMLLNSVKCRTFMSSTAYLGNVLCASGIRPDPMRIKAVATLPFPATCADLKSFFGLGEMLRAFTADYGLVKGLLLPLLKKDAAYLPSKIHNTAFGRLKELIASATLLYNPDMSRTLYLRTDWSLVGIGAVLYQLDATSNIRVIQFLSRALSGAEKNYSAQKGEFLAIKWAVDVLEHWLVGHRDVVIITDHQSLEHCMADSQQNSTIRRWAATIKLVGARFEYRAGSSNVMADFLSRHPMLAESYGPVVVEDESGEDWSKTLKIDSSSQRTTLLTSISSPNKSSDLASQPAWLNLAELARLQRLDSDCSEIINSPDKRAMARVHRVLDFVIEETSGILVAKFTHGASFRSVICAPVALVQDILHHVHNNGHFRAYKTLERVRAQFYWRSMVADTKAFLTNCIQCAERDGVPKTAIPTGQLAAYRPNQLVASDIMGPLPECASGNRHIITFTDHFTKFNVSVAIPDATAETVVRAFINHWVAYFGPPEHLLTDNGSNYTSTLFADVASKLRVHRIYTTPYHPQGDGVAE